MSSTATSASTEASRIGSASSRLMTLLDGSHYDARLSEQERTIIRLWIESSGAYAGTYASLGCGIYPVGLPIPVLANRCLTCHGKGGKSRLRIDKAAPRCVDQVDAVLPGDDVRRGGKATRGLRRVGA